MRSIKELTNPQNTKSELTRAKIYWNPALREYKVKFWREGIRGDSNWWSNSDWDYYTDDKQDAIDTAEVELGLR